MTPTITLSVENGLWIADMSNAHEAEEIFKLFGTYKIPTPYTERFHPTETIAMAIARRNVGHVVSFAPEFEGRGQTFPAGIGFICETPGALAKSVRVGDGWISRKVEKPEARTYTITVQFYAPPVLDIPTEIASRLGAIRGVSKVTVGE